MVWREKGLKVLKFAVSKNESQNHQGGKGLAVCLVHPANSEQGQLDPGYQGLCTVRFWPYPRMEAPEPDWITCAGVRWPLQQKAFSCGFKLNLLFQFVSIAFCAFSGHHWEEPDSAFFTPPIRCLCTLVSSPWAFSSPGGAALALSASACMSHALTP